MALATLTAVMLALAGLQGEDAALRLLLLAATILIFAYGAMAALSAWRALRNHAAELTRALDELEDARARAEEAAEAKSRLLAIITHELRTPMNGVIGMAGLLRETSLTPEQENYVKTIEASGRALLSIIDELLETARAETGEISITQRPFRLSETVEDVCELMSPRAHARNIDLACYVDPAVPESVVGDAGRLRQVLFNLIGNAIRYTDEGGVLVRVVPVPMPAGMQERSGRIRIRFEVEDTGIGIDARDRERIFRAWEQGRNADGRGGTGLGLAISRRLVERLGGRLNFWSTPGKGTVFFFELPLQTGRQEGEIEKGKGEQPLSGRKVHLLIPPSPRRMALAAYVEAHGGIVVPYDDARDSLTALPHVPEREIAVVDAAHAKALRRALAEDRKDLARVWLLLRPEQRRDLQDVMRARHLAGWLLTPLRRTTFCHQLVARMRGRNNGHGQDSREAPEGRAGKPASRASAGTSSVAESESARPLALLVEDNTINAALATALLERCGWQVVHKADGAAALAWLEERLSKLQAENDRNDATCPPGWPEIVIMDVHMPGMNGLEATAALRRLEAAHGLPRTPVLALTAGNSAEERERCLAAGMDGFLAKPFDRADLEEALETLRQASTRPAA